jgi:hypothetical protein
MALAVAAGDFILADQLNALVPLRVVKPTGTARNTTTTLTADPHLSLTFPAGTTHDFDMLLLLQSAANGAGDFKCDVAWTGTATVTVGDFALTDALTGGVAADLAALAVPLDAATPAGTWGFGASTTPTNALLTGHIVTTTLSTVTLHWAQLSSSPNATTLLGGSKFIARRSA